MRWIWRARAEASTAGYRSTVVGSHHIKDEQQPPQQAARQPSHNHAHQPPQQDEDEIPLSDFKDTDGDEEEVYIRKWEEALRAAKEATTNWF